MKKQGALLFALVGVIALTLLAGCNKPASASGSTSGGAPVTITVEIFDRGTDGGKTDPTNNKWTAGIKEKILKDENIIVNFVAVPRWTEAESWVNLFAAGTPPDVAYTYSGDNIQSWADQGGIFDLSPYLDTTLKDLPAFLGPDKALVGKDMIRRNIDLSTGKVYSIPAKRMNVAQRNIFIREDWLKILGLPLPTTTQQYYDTLVAFRDNAAKLGVSTVVPFIMTGERPDWSAGNIMEAFINPNLSDKERWINTVAERSFMVDGYKEGVRFLNKMYNAGLIDKNFPLYLGSSTADTDLVKSGVVGSWSADWDTIYREPSGIFSDLRKNVPTANIVPIDPMTSSDGITHKSAYDAAGINFFIPASAKNPDAAMRYLNWLARYENYHFIQTGPEGITHTIVDGVVKLDPSAAKDPTWIQNSAQNIDYTLMMNGLFLETEEASIRALAAGYSWPADLITKAYNMALTNARPGMVVKTSSPLTVAAPLAQTLVDKAKVIYATAIQAPANRFDAVYDAAVKDWLDSGAQAVIDERRAKYPN
jgi:putative aldouronate transport system substrate-binding protein